MSVPMMQRWRSDSVGSPSPRRHHEDLAALDLAPEKAPGGRRGPSNAAKCSIEPLDTGIRWFRGTSGDTRRQSERRDRHHNYGQTFGEDHSDIDHREASADKETQPVGTAGAIDHRSQPVRGGWDAAGCDEFAREMRRLAGSRISRRLFEGWSCRAPLVAASAGVTELVFDFSHADGPARGWRSRYHRP